MLNVHQHTLVHWFRRGGIERIAPSFAGSVRTPDVHAQLLRPKTGQFTQMGSGVLAVAHSIGWRRHQRTKVSAHELHGHAGPAACAEECDDVGHGLDSCGIRMEAEWRAEQGLSDRTYTEVNDIPDYPQTTAKP